MATPIMTESQQLAAAACATVRVNGKLRDEMFAVIDLLATALQGDGDTQAEDLKLLIRRDKLLNHLQESTCSHIVELVARAEVMLAAGTGRGYTGQQLPHTLELFRRITGTSTTTSRSGMSVKLLLGAAIIGAAVAFAKDR